MSNKFGKLFSFTTWGESHGEAIGCCIDGCPSMIDISEEEIQIDLDRRRPGQSKYTTQRNEGDRVKILSGVFEGKTTGTPISLIIYNENQKSHDYGDIKDKFRPSHADFTYFSKYHIRDYRGGGRSSARETAMRVAAGAVAKKVISKLLGDVQIIAYLTQIGSLKIDRNNIDYSEIDKNPFFCPDKFLIPEIEEYLTSIRKSGDSVGAMIEVAVKNAPVGLGEPIYDKLDARIASGLMSINAVKSVEIGMGSACAGELGSVVADEMQYENDRVRFLSNFSGGIAGGISTGQDIVAKLAIKPTSSILVPRKTIDEKGNNTTIITKGRHDPCVGIRAVPVVEAMMASIIADFALIDRARKDLVVK